MERKPNIFGKWPTKLKKKKVPLSTFAFSMLNFILCCAFVLSPISFLFFSSNQTVEASSAINNLSQISGYSSENGYNYVYFGEYPKTRVLKQKAKEQGKANYGIYTDESIYEENTIKSYIRTLNETYYREFIQDPSSPYYSMRNASYVWTDETGTTTQVQNFYPQEDFEDFNISFDFRSGYYMLKKEVGTYPAGSKFYTYNQAAMWYEKMGANYTYINSSTGNLTYAYSVSLTNLISNSQGDRQSHSGNPDGTQSQAYNRLLTNKIYLFLVEPIKWRVLANSDGYVTLLAENIIDTMSFNYRNNYMNEWAYSDIRGWLNGIPMIAYSSSTNPTVYTRNYNRSFIKRAFTANQEDIIVETENTQDSSASYYTAQWHCYDASLASYRGKEIESYPTTYDKVFLLSHTDLFGTYHSINSSGGLVNVINENSNNTRYGFVDNISRIAYNTDYSIATGNYDAALASSNNYSQNISSGNGGYWYIRSSYVGDYYYERAVSESGTSYTGWISYSYGVRPALRINISEFNSTNFVSETANDISISEFGLSDNPITLSQPTALEENEYTLWNLSSNQSNAVNSTAGWSVVSVSNSGGIYTNKIKVSYRKIKIGTTLYARIIKNGESFLFGAITPKLTASTATKETFFSFISADEIENYDIIIYSGDGYTLYPCFLLQTEIYLNPNGVGDSTNLYPGNDELNDGLTYTSPVQTLDSAYALLGGDGGSGGIIYLMKTLTLSEDVEIGFKNHIVFRRFYDEENPPAFNNSDLILVNENTTVTFTNITFDGMRVETDSSRAITGELNTTIYITNSTFIGNSSKGNGSAINFYGNSLNCLDSAFVNNFSQGNGGAIYLDDSNSVLEVKDCFFENNNSEINGGAIYSNGGMSIERAEFINNSTEFYGGAIYLDNATKTLTIEDCLFKENSTVYSSTSTYGGGAIYSTGDVVIGGNSLTGSQFIGNSTLATGGAIYTTGDITINLAEFRENSAADFGGAIRLKSSSKTLTIKDGLFERNVSNGFGGAIYSLGNIIIGENSLIGSQFIGNSATSYGGAICLESSSGTLTIENCLFEDNSSESLGGVIFSTGKVIIEKTEIGIAVEFISNTAGAGGAIYALNDVTVSDAKFNGNVANNGGAIYSNETLLCTNVLFINNAATNKGGAIYTSGNITHCINCIFNGNSPLGQSGAIYYTTEAPVLEDSEFLNFIFLNPETVVNESSNPFAGNDANDGSSYRTPVQSIEKAYELLGGNNSVDGVIYLMKSLIISENTEIGFLQHVTIKRFYDDTNETTIASSNTGSLVQISTQNITVKFSNITFDGVGEEIKFSGGAINVNVSNVTLSIEECNFINHFMTGTSSIGGGAIYFASSGTSKFTCINSNFFNNSVTMAAYAGGAIYFSTSTTSSIEINTSTFFNNVGVYSISYGGAIYSNSGNLKIIDSVFSENRGGYYGGAIYLTGGSSEIINSNFSENRTSAYGGAIYFSSGSLKITNSLFSENTTSSYGGAIYSAGTFTCINTTFFKNTISNYGGAIYFSGGSSKIIDSFFSENKSSYYGGAIYGSFTSLICENSSFIGNTATNYGGAIYAATWRETDYFMISYSSFIGNTASIGGGIYTVKALQCFETEFINNSSRAIYATENVTCDSCNFYGNNPSGKEGAIFSSGKLVLIYCEFNRIYVNSNSQQSENNPYPGSDNNDGLTFQTPVLTLDRAYSLLNGEGSIYLCKTLSISEDISIDWSEKITIKRFYDPENLAASNIKEMINISSGANVSISNVNFSGSRLPIAFSGGAILNSGNLLIINSNFISNISGEGGAIYNTPLSNLECINTTFINNSATTGNGGAIFSHSNIIISEDSLFSGNIAKNGGAIYVKGVLSVEDSSSFVANTAEYGGAIYVDGGNLDFNSTESYLSNNTATSDGGAIYLNTTKTSNLQKVNFVDNYSEGNGGAIFINNSGNLSFSNATFTDNYSEGSGGAVYNKNCEDISFLNSIFTYNISKEFGGAIYNNNNPQNALECINTDFIRNNAYADLGIAIYTKGDLNCNECKFEENLLLNGLDGSIYCEGILTFSQSEIVKMIYLNPNGTLNSSSNPYPGKDTNNGTSYKTPILTLEQAYNLMENETSAIIFLMKTSLTINSDITIGLEDKKITIKRFYDNTDAQSLAVSNTTYLLNIKSGKAVSIINVTFESLGNTVSSRALYAETNTTVTINNSSFINNETNYNGAAIYFAGTTLICDETVFFNNKSNSWYYGGAIYVTSYATKVEITNSSFIENSAYYGGGAIYIGSSNITSLIIDNCLFKGNYNTYTYTSNSYGGGAINSIANINCTNSTFVDNVSYNGGGAINLYEATMTCLNSIFINNKTIGSIYGGAIRLYNLNSNSNNLFQDCSFVGNYSYYGGAIYIDISKEISLNQFENCSFISNTSRERGTIYIYASSDNNNRTLLILECLFEGNETIGNSGQYGAAIFSQNVTIICSETEFINNKVTQALGTSSGGGAIYSTAKTTITDSEFTENYSGFYGGAIFLDNSSKSLTIDNCFFESNYTRYSTSSYGGGAIYSSSPMTVKNSTFLKNSSAGYCGGAIYCGSSLLLEVENCVFEENSANYSSSYGGAIYSNADTSIFKSDFINNKSRIYGGSIYLTNSSKNLIVEESFFENNYTNDNFYPQYGGAIFSYGIKTTIKDSSFKGFYAIYSGGAVLYNSQSGELLVQNCIFEDNHITTTTSSSSYGGGAIGCYGILTVKDSSFKDNVCGTYGGAIRIENNYSGNDSLIENCVFENNETLNYGGGVVYSYYGSLNIVDSIFNSNSCMTNGGAIYFINNFILTIDNSTFDKNETKSATSGGGAIYTTSNATIYNSTFTENTSYYYGGAVYINASGRTLSVEDCLFENNRLISTVSSTTYGGGAIRSFGTTNIVRTDFLYNSIKSGSGGAVWVSFTTTITDSKFIENIAFVSGGAIYLSGNYTLTCTRCYFKGNFPVGRAGAISSTLTPTLIDCEFVIDIFLDPSNGNDNNNGLDYSAPVLTIERAYQLLEGAGIIYLMKTWTISTSRTVGWLENIVTIKRFYDNTNAATLAVSNQSSLIVIASGITVNFINIILDGGDSEIEVNGGALKISSASTVNISNSTFRGNRVSQNGGAIYNSGKLKLTDTIFDFNSAVNGGGIYSEKSVEILNSTFRDNNAQNNGGGIYLDINGDIEIYEENTFICNNAKNGGAIYSTGSLSITNATFSENTSTDYGSAIYSSSGSKLLTVEDCIFEENISNQNGGAFYLHDNSIASFINCIFEGNSAVLSGGAVYSNGILTIEDCSFDGNYAVSTTEGRGGAIYVNGGTVEIEEIFFIENSAYQGGAIYATGTTTNLIIWNGYFEENTAVDAGGALNIQNSAKLTVYYAEFINNYVSVNCGGAIHSGEGIILIYDGVFLGNSAGYGGALSASTSSSWTIYGGSFIDNISSGSIEGGGAIRINYNAEVSISNAIFENNTASDNYGGAIYIGKHSSPKLSILSDSTFSSNSALKGGAIYAEDSSPLNITDCRFTDNTVTMTGGAIWASVSVTATDCFFIGNIASTSGGAIYISGINNVSCIRCYFEGNIPRGRLGAIFSAGLITLTDCDFLNFIYVNPDGNFNEESNPNPGKDSNDGFGLGINVDGSEAPIQDINLAISILNGEGTIYLLKPMIISTDMAIGNSIYHVKILRGYDSDYVDYTNASHLFSISGDAEVHFLNVTLDGLSTFQSPVPAIRVQDTAHVYFDSSTVIQNCYTHSSNNTASGIYSAEGTKVIFGDTIVRNCDYNFLRFAGAVEINGLYAENFGERFAHADGEFNSFVMNRGSAVNGGRFLVDNSTSSSQIIIKNAYFYNLFSQGGHGGAIYSTNSNATFLIENSVFENCSAGGNSGGALYIESSLNVTINNSFFKENSSNVVGGHIRIRPSSDDAVYTFLNCDFINGSSARGGAIFIDDDPPFFPSIVIDNCIFSENESKWNGMAISVSANNLLITNTLFNNNKNSNTNTIEEIRTGAVTATIKNSFTMTNCELMGNTVNANAMGQPNRGAGLYLILLSATIEVTITDCKISGNTLLGTDAIGGGIYISNTEAGGIISISNTQISGNHSAGSAGGAYIDITGAESVLSIIDCVFANNISNSAIGAIGMPSTNRIGTLFIENCIFEGNFSVTNAIGALYFRNGVFNYNTFDFNQSSAEYNLFISVYGNVQMDGETYINNSANGTGSVFNLVFAHFNASLKVENSVFIANTTTSSSLSNSPISIEENFYAKATFINCQFSENSGKTGGAIYSMANSLILQNCIFNDNLSSSEGGAVYARNLTITNSTFSGNSSVSSGGALRALTQTTITHSTFKNNNNGNAFGGAIMLDGTALLENVFVYNNSSLGNGGGIALAGTATLTNCHIYSNTASGDGGGVFHNSGTATFNSCNIHSNTANRGGGIYSTQTFSIQSSNIYLNNALSLSNYSGGGLYLSGTATITTSNIYDNFGASMGGGMVVWTNTMISNSKIYSNSSFSGGGILMVYGLGNSIEKVEFANNSAQFGGAIYQASIAQSTEKVYTRIVNSTFLNNSAFVSDGAVFINWHTDFVDCSFIGNVAETGSVNRLNGGYVVPIGTTYYTNSSLTTVGGITSERVKGTNINQNYFTNSSGNMFFSTAQMLALEEVTSDVNWQKVSFTDCYFEANISLSGGIISSSESNSFFPSQIVITNSNIIGNSDGTGAALQVQNHTVANITQTYFKDNTGSTSLVGEKNGGGVSVGNFAILNLTNCTFHSTVDENIIFAERNGTLILTNPNITAESNIIFTRGPVETAAGSFISISGGTLSGIYSINGGALYIGGIALVENIIISSCVAEESGGAIYVSETGVLTFNATIQFCNAINNSGKGIYSLGSVTMIGGTISSNTISSQSGGGVFVAGGIFTMQGGIIRDNYGWKGGGIYIATGASAVINNGTISMNRAHISGGGVYVAAGAFFITGVGAIISDNTVHSSSAEIYGIGVYNAGIMTMNGGTISGNDYGNVTESYGGGIYSAENSSLTIKNAIIINNRTYNNGGGILLSSGSIAYIEETMINNNKSVDYAGGAIYSISAKINIIGGEISQSYTDNLGTITATDSAISIKNCRMENNIAAKGASIYFSGNSLNLIIENCSFEENNAMSSDEANDIFVVSANLVKIIDSKIERNFYNNESSSAITIKSTNNFEIIGCSISGNIQSGALSEGSQNIASGINIYGVTATQGIIKNCIFENNIGKSGGALSINLTNSASFVNIIDCTFTGNQSVGYFDETHQTTYGGIGGGIYIGGSATVNFAGRIEVTDNFSHQIGGGIYVASGAKMNISKKTVMIVKNNLTACSNATETVIRNGVEYTITVLQPAGTSSNLHLSSTLNLLEGDLSPLSEIYLTTNVSVGGKVFSATNKFNTFITSADLQLFHSDAPDCIFWLDTAQNAVFSVALEANELQVIVHDLVFVKKERTLTDDGKYGVSSNHFQVLNAPMPYSIEFYATSDGSSVANPNTITAWTSLSPRFGAIGNYTIYYKVSTVEQSIIGALNLHILGKSLYIEKAPTASLKYGETLSRAVFSDWSVKDEDDNSVAGIWLFSQSTTVPSGINTRYDLTFTPYRANYYEQNPTTSITVSIGFNIVFYKPSAQAGAGGEFYNDEDCTASTSITTLGTMLSYLNNGGSVIFKGTYQVGVINDLAQVQNLSKTIYFIRHYSAITSPIFEVVSGASAAFSAQNGKIIFEGAGQYSGIATAQATVILNQGFLDLKTNVIFRNFNSQGAGEVGALGAVITNAITGTLLLNGCEIYGNTARNLTADGENLGGAIYNAGEMIINSGKFFANSTTGIGGKGGFVFTVGELMFNGGEIYANTSYLGGGVYVGENGSAYLNGGELRFNTSSSFGGGAFVAEQGKAFLFGTDIYSNRAGDDGGGIYSDGGTLYSQTFEGVSEEAAFEIMQSQNQSFSTFSDQPNQMRDHSFPIIFAILIFLMLSFVILNEKPKLKIPFDF